MGNKSQRGYLAAAAFTVSASFFSVKGFGRKMKSSSYAEVLAKSLFRIAGHEYDSNIRITLTQVAEQGWTVHFRHDHIADH